MGMNPIGGYFGTILPLMNGVADPGGSVHSAREDHVHPKDTTKVDVDDFETLDERLQLVEGYVPDFAGLMFMFNVEVAVDDWAEDEELGAPAVVVSVPVPGLEAESAVQLMPVGMTTAAFEALSITVSIADEGGALVLKKAEAPDDAVAFSVLYTKPGVFGVPTVPEPDPGEGGGGGEP